VIAGLDLPSNSILDDGPGEVVRVLDLSGKTSLRELASVLAACDAMVSADTGPMHLAVAVGTPVIALFGSTNPDRTGPYGKRNIVLTSGIACSPCYRKPTCNGRIDCMKDLTPEAVRRAVEERLGLIRAIARPLPSGGRRA
jgi:heptosyltransferase-1